MVDTKPPFKVSQSDKNIARSLRLVATREFKEGDIISKIEGKPASDICYHTVQVDEDKHIELTNDLTYCNHSCEPTTILDTTRMVVVALKDLKEGDELTFFYPSSEWDMAESFNCACGSSQCIHVVKGAKYTAPEVLSRYFINEHIRKQLE
ncbi:hypothetical protein K493DRAFT_334488 [Basidiobolus meristosporus CBS 931.73]|uniref:SET domain-containing protein n=1 Tax=Basidiobolus meristosporus CBS 931.73 TaxID=1314790 RepID=A0A1Y1YXT4_9FUNG|nr:hypothetical protein K493DRAFT_334488 [Basidiobolus meristosporus CBS 931.73]|eukprot:ORY02789.1 hypothetical protein K493DRAFT_334488 [Basidiobolus meristosporus CBS 931.73]